MAGRRWPVVLALVVGVGAVLLPGHPGSTAHTSRTSPDVTGTTTAPRTAGVAETPHAAAPRTAGNPPRTSRRPWRGRSGPPPVSNRG
ncbi:hypothetical protein [Saccharothrix longispora]|uniref:hypothetical protein n=1 Tax=Saccharothrix longispora TaxID=33920 RepID=UPI0028FD3B1B|nr:hypothetical protein [Saccharothrix longispora]MBY8849351.1 hypothetical protein [Saccharothrix sp. MB29]MDU0290750.1 hypothetical protein [Saccharothrix longispora]